MTLRKIAIVLLLLVAVIAGACHSSRMEAKKKVRQLRNSSGTDTSFVYTLPYEKGKSYTVIQGYFGAFSHRNRAAIDFNLGRGDTIMAARGGIVSRVKQDGNRGGLRRKYRADGNNIVILHEDSSRAGYWHLKENGALVKQGDVVRAGQPIALSGKTGYAAAPHLHFIVWRRTNAGWQQRPTLFKTRNGPRYLRSWHRYRAPLN